MTALSTSAPLNGDRARIGKLAGMIGSASAGERANAVDLADKALGAMGASWQWLGMLCEHGELPGTDRDRLFCRLLRDRLKGSEVAWWTIGGQEAGRIRAVLAACGNGLGSVPALEIEAVIGLADRARQLAGR
jgi:hypothetical protein